MKKNIVSFGMFDGGFGIFQIYRVVCKMATPRPFHLKMPVYPVDAKLVDIWLWVKKKTQTGTTGSLVYFSFSNRAVLGTLF